MQLRMGSVVAGAYQIVRLIATGGMGEVWEARDLRFERGVAVKVLRSEFATDPEFVARFHNEAKVSKGLSHPNIAAVFEYGTVVQEGAPLAYLVLEYVPGEPLNALIHRDGPLPAQRTVQILEQAATGLGAAHHAGVVHRDVKPANVIVRPDGIVKVTDFGIALARDAVRLTRTGLVIGTPQYLSPEQSLGKDIDARSDVYALGILGYECLTGAAPFEGVPPHAVAAAHVHRPVPRLSDTVPPLVRGVLERALEKDRTKRYRNGSDFAAALREAATGPTVSATSATAVITGHVAPRGTLIQPLVGETDPSPWSGAVPPGPPGSFGGGGPPVGPGPWPGPGPGPTRQSKGLLVALVGLLLLALLLAGVGILTGAFSGTDRTAGPSTGPTGGQPATSASPPTAQTGTTPPTPTTSTPPGLPESPPIPPTYAVAGGQVSRFSDLYYADVVEVTGSGYLLEVQIDAHGAADLRRPETSCVHIDGDDNNGYVSAPASADITETTTASGTQFVGTMTFPALISGSYSFNYSCAPDYSEAYLGEVSAPNLGISRYDAQYYAVVLGTSGTRLDFAAHGGTDLRDPQTSCLYDDTGATLATGLQLSYTAETFSATYVGTLTFDSVPTDPSFVYSCTGDYTPVPLTG